MLDIPALLRLASLAPQHLKLPTYFCANPKDRGYEISDQVSVTSHKFMGRVEQMFKNLPKPTEWRPFYNNDLPLVIDFCGDVREVSVEHHLNKSQTRALAKLKEASEEDFQNVVLPVCRAGIRRGIGDVHWIIGLWFIFLCDKG